MEVILREALISLVTYDDVTSPERRCRTLLDFNFEAVLDQLLAPAILGTRRRRLPLL